MLYVYQNVSTIILNDCYTILFYYLLIIHTNISKYVGKPVIIVKEDVVTLYVKINYKSSLKADIFAYPEPDVVWTKHYRNDIPKLNRKLDNLYNDTYINILCNITLYKSDCSLNVSTIL